MRAFLIPLVLALSPAVAGAAGSLAGAEHHAWSETAGWLDLDPAAAGVQVYDDHLEGYAWSENAGWIRLGTYAGGGYHTYANGSAADWGVNLDGANLTGYAWSETAGWIRFDPGQGGVTLDPASGVFDGWAWSENLGWIHFDGGAAIYGARFMPAPEVKGVLVDATDTRRLYAAVAGSGFHISDDGGATWTAAATQPADRRIKAAVASPIDPATLYVATHGGGVYRSTDQGLNWAACGGLDPRVHTLAIDGVGTLYAATRGGIQASTDCSAWADRSTGLPDEAGHYRPAVLALDPATPGTLHAGIDGAGVYSSRDGGATWLAAAVQPAGIAIRALLIKPGSGATLFAASHGDGVFVSGDGGLSWTACATQPGNLGLRTLAMDDAGKLYAGTEAGVYLSEDTCASWTALNTGLPN